MVTESHLRRSDLEIVKIPGQSSFSRQAEEKKMGGGVAILVHTKLTAATAETGAGDNEPAEYCPAFFYPAGKDVERLEIPGGRAPLSRTE